MKGKVGRNLIYGFPVTVESMFHHARIERVVINLNQKNRAFSPILIVEMKNLLWCCRSDNNKLFYFVRNWRKQRSHHGKLLFCPRVMYMFSKKMTCCEQMLPIPQNVCFDRSSRLSSWTHPPSKPEIWRGGCEARSWYRYTGPPSMVQYGLFLMVPRFMPDGK